ncbi:MAG TPA: hypothetical protein VFA60_00670 [Terriglobales bacterium]|nr:hypothetical protein [Terriglobales bacterium]
MRLHLESMAIEMPRVSRHPNRQPFHGVLTMLDVPSDKAPSGARGRRVMLTRRAAEAALPSLLGMALDYTPELDGHDARRKVGIITAADIVPVRSAAAGASRVDVRGYLFARDFPEVVQRIRGAGQRDLGMSYEVADARVADVRSAVWTLVEFTFTGAAVLLREKAAYGATWIALGSPENEASFSVVSAHNV